MSHVSAGNDDPGSFASPDRTIVDALLVRIQSGDTTAQAELIERLVGFVHAAAHNLLRGRVRVREQTEDVTQDVMTSLLSSFPSIRDLSHCQATLRRMVVHHVDNLYKKHMRDCRDIRREVESVAPAEGFPDGALGRELTPPPQAAQRYEGLDRLRLILDSLRPGDRRLLDAKLAGESLVPIAKESGETVDAVRMRQARVIKSVRESWRRRDPDSPPGRNGE